MAYNNNLPRAEYTASASQTVFPFLFKIFTSSDIKVYQTPVGQDPDDVADLLTLTTDYTVTINGDAGGEITLVTGATNGDKITLLRNLDITRNIEYQSQGDLTADTLNLDQEYQTYLIADREAIGERYIKLSENAQEVSATLPAPVSNAYFRWSTDALSIINDTTIPDAVTTSAANAVAAAASATQAQLYEWEAEAERLTADSYATEAEDTFVNLVTSDGDGTFTYTPTTEYSSLHWAAKAATFNPALYALLTGATFTGQVKGITPISAEDLTRKDYVDGLIVIASTAEAQAGTENTKTITSLRLHEAMLAGVTQAWTDVTGSRSAGVTYTNTTGRPIVVNALGILGSATLGTIGLTVDGFLLNRDYEANNAWLVNVTAIIPNGSTYTIDVTGVATLNAVYELR